MRVWGNTKGHSTTTGWGLCVIVIIFILGYLPACSSKQPAPVEEQSTLIKKRMLNTDGTYSVRSGDTLYAIAFHYGMDPQAIASWNGIASPYVIRTGQKLRMMAPPPGSQPARPSTAVTVVAAKPQARATTKPATTSPAETTRQPPAASPVTTKAPQKQVATEADPKSWRWPTQGRVLRGFVSNNPSRNGLDITGREGQAIEASAPGQVVYSGNGLIGYGELIIIRHSEKMLSAYAHNRVRLVQEGDSVDSGQKIAEMGRNPGNEQILHFEIRVRGKPVNPMNYLPNK